MTQTLAPTADPTRVAARFARILPLAFITYALAYLDRVNYGYAEAGGLRATLHINANQSSLLASSFFAGYFLFQIPGASYAAHRSVKKLIFWALLLWGILSAGMGLISSVPLLVAARFALGVVESVVFPAMLIFLTHWFTKRERSKANTLLIVGNPLTMAVGSFFSGALIQFFDRHSVFRLQGWQMMFVLEGLPSVLWAFAWWFLADDRPIDANWLTSDQSAAVQGVLDEEQRDISAMRDYWAAFRDPRVVLLSVMYFCWSVGTYGLVIWLPKIIRDTSHFNMADTGYLSGIPYFLAIFTMLIVSYWSDKLLERKLFIWPAMLVGGAAFLVAAAAGPGHFWVMFVMEALAGAAVYTPCGPLWALIAEMVPRNVVGESMALVNSAGAIGGFVGSYMVGYLTGLFNSNAPGFLLLAASMLAAGLITIIVRSGRSTISGFPVIVQEQTRSSR